MIVLYIPITCFIPLTHQDILNSKLNALFINTGCQYKLFLIFVGGILGF